MTLLPRRAVLAFAAAPLAASVAAAEPTLSNAPLAAPSERIRAVDLRCEYLVDPLGIDVVAPRLSWRCEAALRQTAYRIRVISAGAPIWDTGRVASAQTCQIRYAGPRLRSRQAVAWSVQLWDQDGRTDPDPTTIAYWTMGLLDEADWQADWIGLETPLPPETLRAEWFWSDEGVPMAQTPPGQRRFRRAFTLDRPLAAGDWTAFVSAGDFARLAIDGAPLGDAYGWAEATPMRLPALAAGRHVLTAVATNLGDVAKPAGLAVRLDPLFATAAGWRATIDAPAAWQTPQFDDAAWRPVVAWGPTGIAPWGPLALHRPRPVPARWLRREFHLPDAPAQAEISFCGLGWSELHVNGTRVGDAMLSPPLTDYDRHVTYVTYNIASLLRRGDNAIAVVLGPGRFVAPRPSARTYGWPKLRLRLDVTAPDGTRVAVTSDAAWAITLDGPIRDAHEYDGEIFDARQAMPGWAEPGFDASAWRPAQLVAPPTGRPVAMRQNPTRITGQLPPIRITQTAPNGWTFDFGQNIAGICRLQTIAPAGTTITLQHAERLHPDGTLDGANLRSALARDILTTARAGPQTFTPRFTSHGFRYACVTGLTASPTPETLTALVMSDDLRRTGTFDCSDPLLTRIHEAALWSVRNNCRSIRTDCPQRDERQGWLGDPAVEARGEAYAFDNAAFYAKWLGDMLDTQRPNGALADIAPAYWPLYNNDLAWPAALAIIPGILHDHYNDTAVLAAIYPNLLHWLDHVQENPTDTYGDWGAPGAPDAPGPAAHPDPLIAAAYLQHCLALAADYAARLGQPTQADALAARAATQRDRFQNAFYRPQDGLYGDAGATACILTLAFDLAAPHQVAALRDRLFALILATGAPHPCFGLIGSQWVNRVLQKAGRGDLAHLMAVAPTRPGLGYMIEQGATTLWERWDADTADPAMASLDHTMLTGDLLVWLYRDLAGIRHDPAQPGFARAILAPRPVSTLTWVSASYAAITGIIESAWHRGTDEIVYQFSLPPNVGATVHLPAEPPFDVPPGRHAFTRRL